MSDDPAARMGLGRRIAVVALSLYIALLALAACVEPLRPPFLDGAQSMAARTLYVLGIRAGLDVFRQEATIPMKDRNDCPRIRGLATDGSLRPLYPEDGRCRTSGLRLYVKKSRQAHELLLRQAKRHHLLEAEGGDVRDAYWRDRPLVRLAETYCVRNPALARIDVAWTVKLVDIRDGRLISGEYLVYAFDCEARTITEAHWLPKPEAVRAFWGGDPWAE